MNNLSDVMMYGGGHQTVTMIAMIVNGDLPRPERIVMADTGRERTAVLDYLDEVVQPALRRLSLQVEIASHELSAVDLEAKNGDLLLPVFTVDGKLPTFCSDEWKARVCARYLRGLGYGPDRPIRAWFGMSLDEYGRMRKERKKWQTNWYPLIENEATRLRRHECGLYLARHGWPIPPKSACWMCPHRDDETWREIKENEREDWNRAVALDRELRAGGKWGAVYLHRQRVPLDEVDFTKPEPLRDLFGECAGSCWT